MNALYAIGLYCVAWHPACFLNEPSVVYSMQSQSFTTITACEAYINSVQPSLEEIGIKVKCFVEDQ